MKFTKSLHWRIAIAYIALLFVTMGAVSLYLINFVQDRFTEDLQERLTREATLIGQTPGIFAPDQATKAAVESFAMSIDGRVTVVDSESLVVADSLGAALPDNRIAPELREALRGSETVVVRSDPALGGEELSYAAVPIEIDGTLAGAVRVGAPTATVGARVNRIAITVAIAGAVVALLSIVLGWLVARRTTRSVMAVAAGARRLASGDLDHRVGAIGTDESRDLAVAFNRMARTIRSTVTALKGEQAKLSAVLDTMVDGVVVANSGGEVTLINQAAREMLDMSESGPVQTRLAGALWDHDLIALTRRAIEVGKPCYEEVELFHNSRTVVAVATPISQGGDGGALLTLHDLTRQRMVETTRREFVSNVSHELRSPLASMKAMVETLRGGAVGDPPKAAEFLRRIDEEIDRMTGLVAEFLELSRLESGQVLLRAEPFELGPIVESVKERLAPRAEAQGVLVEAGPLSELPMLHGESGKIAQVLFNLIDNALHFTPSGGSVDIQACTRDGFVEVTVKDTGAGIEPEHLPHVFERFYKADRSRSSDGVGLGLAITRHIVQVHGGEVSVESELGMGASFSFTLPVNGNGSVIDP